MFFTWSISGFFVLYIIYILLNLAKFLSGDRSIHNNNNYSTSSSYRGYSGGSSFCGYSGGGSCSSGGFGGGSSGGGGAGGSF